MILLQLDPSTVWSKLRVWIGEKEDVKAKSFPKREIRGKYEMEGVREREREREREEINFPRISKNQLTKYKIETKVYLVKFGKKRVII